MRCLAKVRGEFSLIALANHQGRALNILWAPALDRRREKA